MSGRGFFTFLMLVAFGSSCFAAELSSPAAAPKTAKDLPPAASVKKDGDMDEKKKEEKQVARKITGIITFIRKNRISVEYASDDETGGQEMLLNLDAKTKMNGSTDLSQLKQGDRVEITYIETYREPKEKDQAPAILNKVGAQIRLLKAAP